jgi:urease accessory protein
VSLSVKPASGGTALDRLRMSGSLKCLFPRRTGPAVDAVLINTAGGITGGDRFEVAAEAAPDTALTITTQAAERAYRAQPGEIGHLTTALRLGRNARLHWLPQETILFNGSALNRQLRADLAPGASLLLAEPLIFGRTEMGEVMTDARFRDCIDIRRDGHPLFLDRTAFSDDVAGHLDRPHVADGARAMALIVYVAAEAGLGLDRLRALLPDTAGASLIGPDVVVARFLAADGYALRKTLLPALTFLSDAELPKCWTL